MIRFLAALRTVRFSPAVFRVLRIVLAVFLLTAAVLKLQGGAPEVLAQNTPVFTPPVQMATIEAEIVLGLWLLLGLWVNGLWVTTTFFFTTLAVVSLYLGFQGQSTCGCFGRLRVSPWMTLGADLTAVIALFFCRPPQLLSTLRIRKLSRPVAYGGMAAGACVLLIVLAGSGPAKSYLSRLRGEWITVEPSVHDLGEGVRGEVRILSVRLTNHADRPVRIIGGISTCSCFVADDLPVTLEAGVTQEISIRAKFVGTSGVFRQQFVLFTDADRQTEVIAWMTGRVLESPTSEEPSRPGTTP